MKKLFTLVALLAMVLGANAKWGDTPIYTIDYSTYQGFPFYVMGYVPEFDNGCMTDFGAGFGYKTDDEMADFTGGTEVGTVKTQSGAVYHKVQLDAPAWHQYFIADGISTKIDGKYKVVAKVKASAPCTININMGWSWQEDPKSASVSIPDGADFQEVTWEYEGIGGANCNLVAQPGGSTETIEWLSLEVYQWEKEGGRVPEWLEDIENGDAETPWTAEQAAIAYNDMEKNFTICAWSKEKGHNMNEEGTGWNPFVAPIVVDPLDENNHAFLCDGQPATTEGDASAWDNQFWIQSKHAWKSGLTMKIKFRYMASQDVTCNTQFHKQTPSDYLIWHSIGDITFSQTWQTFDKDMSIGDDMAGGWSIAFNLNSSVKDAVKFYFDDLSWKYLKLDEGFFLAGINQTKTKDYDDLDNAIPFEATSATDFEATIGTKGAADTYVDQLMVSTTRGDDAAFKGATLMPSGKIHNDAEEWLDYVQSANKRLDVPGLGVWKVYIDTKYNAMAFEMLEGTPYDEQDPVAVYTYADEITVNGQEREYTEAEAEAAGLEKPENPGQPWDNQFFIVADRVVKAGEATTIKFQYKATVAGATSGTQSHGEPGGYIHWAAIGSLTFEEEWQDFENDFTIPAECDGSEGKQFKSIAFNLAEIKGACDYSFRNVQWYLKDASLDEGLTYENLISGSTNFYKKEGAGTNPYTGITNVTAKNAKVSNVMYNLAGQRVSKDFKGIVVKDGKKFVK